ncbi:cell division protein FtsL [Bdellovibrionota bacterium FG-2]
MNLTRRTFLGIPIWVFPVFALFAVGTVWLRLAIVRTTYAINQADRTERNLQQEREQIHLKVTALRSPRRLENIAKTKFGLSQPSSDQVIYMKETDEVHTQQASPKKTQD